MQAFDKIEWVKDGAWLQDFNLRYSLYSSSENLGSEIPDKKMLAAFLGKPCKE